MRDVSVEEYHDALELNSSYDYDHQMHYFLPSRSSHLLSCEELEELVVLLEEATNNFGGHRNVALHILADRYQHFDSFVAGGIRQRCPE